MSKKLVAYFSASGVTERAAAKVAKAADADLFEIKPKIPYTTEDLNWMNKQSRSSIEMSDPSSRPEIEERVEGGKIRCRIYRFSYMVVRSADYNKHVPREL